MTKKQTLISNTENVFQTKWYKSSSIVDQIQELKLLEIKEELDDFLIELLPYTLLDSDESLKKKALSLGWCLYCHRTIIIEQAIIIRYCGFLLAKQSSFDIPDIYNERLSQVQIDECFHTLMSQVGIDRVLLERDLNNKYLCDTELELELQKSDKDLDPRSHELYLLAACLVCESTLTKYLSIFPDRLEVQPFCRIITKIHKQDEATHSNIFIELYNIISKQCSDEEIQQLNSYIELFKNFLINSTDKAIWKSFFEDENLTFVDEINEKYFSLYSFNSIEKLES